MRGAASNQRADGLNDGDDQHDGDHRRPYDVHAVVVIAVGDGVIAEAARADVARHGGQADQIDQRDRRAPGDGRGALAQIDAQDDADGG